VDLGVLGLGLKDFVGVVTYKPTDVVGLSGSHGRVDHHYAGFLNVFGIEGAGEQLVVGAVNRVAALEDDDMRVFGETSANFSRGLAGEGSLGERNTGKSTTDVVLGALHGNHLDARVLQGRSTIALLNLKRFIGGESGLDVQNGNRLALVSEGYRFTRGKVITIGVHDDRKTEQKVGARKSDMFNVVIVHIFIHKSSQRRKSTDAQDFSIASLAIVDLKLSVHVGELCRSGLGISHQVYQGATMRNDASICSV